MTTTTICLRDDICIVEPKWVSSSTTSTTTTAKEGGDAATGHADHHHHHPPPHSFEKAQAILSQWVRQSQESLLPLLGFDMEWTTTSRGPGPVAVVQLSTGASQTIVLRWMDLVAHAKGKHNDERCQAMLRDVCYLLESECVLKVGVGILGDMQKLYRDYPILFSSTSSQYCTSPREQPSSAGSSSSDSNSCGSLRGFMDVVTLLQKLPKAATAKCGVADQVDGNGVPLCPCGSTSIRSLKHLTRHWTGIAIPKATRTASSNWGNEHAPLTPTQIQYAADDAAASFLVAEAMINCLGDKQRSVLLKLARQLVNVAPKGTVESSQSTAAAIVSSPVGSLSTMKKLTEGPSAKFLEKAEQAFEPRKNATFYDNIECYDPSGELLFTVDKRKAYWYVVKKNLAVIMKRYGEVVSVIGTPTTASRNDGMKGDDDTQTAMQNGCCEESDEEEEGEGEVEGETAASDGTLVPQPLNENRYQVLDGVSAIQLKFTPSFGRYNDQHLRRDFDYYRRPKKNCCVVCGDEQRILRFAVVPLMYRKHFPHAYVSHNSYDLLLICPKCFGKVTFYYNRERQRIAEEFNFPLVTNRRELLSSENGGTESADGGDERKGASGANKVFERVCEARFAAGSLLRTAAALLREATASCVSTPTTVEECDNDETKSALPEPSSEPGPPATPLLAPDVSPSTTAPMTKPKTKKGGPRSSGKPKPSKVHQLPAARKLELEAQFRQGTRLFVGALRDEQVTEWVRQLDSTASDDPPLGTASGAIPVDVLRAVSNAELHQLISRRLAEIEGEEGGVSRSGEGGDDDNGVPQDSHAAFVVRTLLKKYPGNTDFGVGEFIVRWRSLFLSTMEPKHLPEGWVVTEGVCLPPSVPGS